MVVCLKWVQSKDPAGNLINGLRLTHDASSGCHQAPGGATLPVAVAWHTRNWQTVYIEAALDHLREQGHPIDPDDVARLSPLYHANINLQGRYQTTTRPAGNQLRPLRIT